MAITPSALQKRISMHVKFTEHARLAMRDDDLTTERVIEAIKEFEIIEKYPNSRPFPSCLLLCRLEKSKPLHIVCALPNHVDMLIIVTVYIPSEKDWLNYRRRKE